MPRCNEKRAPEFSLGLRADLFLQHTEGLPPFRINHLLHVRGRRR